MNSPDCLTVGSRPANAASLAAELNRWISPISLKIVAEDQTYAGKYQHVAAHSYNETGDAAYSQAAAHLSQAFCSGYYPELTFNLTKDNTGTSTDPETIKAHIDAIYKEVADAGITAVSRRNGSTLSIKAGIKAAKAGTYRIAAWVLEDGIRSKQERP